ncbi:hypothetical protein KCU73_g78, partial [Aureobasidium melanogenum]
MAVKLSLKLSLCDEDCAFSQLRHDGLLCIRRRHDWQETSARLVVEERKKSTRSKSEDVVEGWRQDWWGPTMPLIPPSSS